MGPAVKAARFNERAARVANGFERPRVSEVFAITGGWVGPGVGPEGMGYPRQMVEDAYLAGRRDRRR